MTMSIIFGMLKPSDAKATEEELLQLAQPTEHYAIDGTSVHTSGRIGMGFQAYYTHLRSKLETGPACDSHGNLLAFDGRLDNHRELCHELDQAPALTADSQIVLALFIRCGEKCFSRLIGDWAAALWSTRQQSLYLARDHAGTRTLYFQKDNGTLRWSTYLETFFVDGAAISLDEDYAACYLASLPVRDLTPYKGIQAIPPAHFLEIKGDRIERKAHWEWRSPKRIRYNSDKEYEEQFLGLFRQSIERRTGPGAPILAHLSGGMDSSSIVCMSDHIRRSMDSSAGILDTVSFYDDTEPNWNERPYFSAVEAKRGKTGIHIATSFLNRTFEPSDPAEGIYLFPGADSSAVEQERIFQNAIQAGKYRAILSGIGGDELLGGVPTPVPELADYLASGDFNLLFRQATAWCLTARTPLMHILFDVVVSTLNLYRRPSLDWKSIPPWLQPQLLRTYRSNARREYLDGRRPFPLKPSSVCNGLAWWTIVETLPNRFPEVLARHEYRYPYLDRDLVDYLFSIPREQLVRPGRRRSLMRRALSNIVPTEVLERRRKAFIIRGPLDVIRRKKDTIDELFSHSWAVGHGLIDPGRLRSSLTAVLQGNEPRWWPSLIKLITFELWMKTNPKYQRPLSYLNRSATTSGPQTGLAEIRASRAVR
jgi:asparagine synthase (glutamine-hydrolysing)